MSATGGGGVDLGSARGSIELDSSPVTRSLRQAATELRAFTASTAGVGSGLRAVGDAATGMGTATEQGAARANAAILTVQQHALAARQAVQTLSTTALLAGGGLAAGLGASVKTAASFEAQLSVVRAVSGATDAQMAQLSATAQALGKDVTLSGVSARDAARAMGDLSKAGVSVDDQLQGAARGALLIASAGTEVGRAATIAANAMTVFSKSGSDIPHIADLLVGAANASTVEVTDLADSLAQGGQVAAQFGQSIEQTTAVLAAFGAAGLRGSDAGTSMRTMLLALVNPSKEAQAVMQQYGLSFFDASGRMKDFAGIAQTLRDGLGQLSDRQRNAALATIFGTDAIRGATILYNQGASGIADWTQKVDRAGSAAEAGRIRNNNLVGSWNQLKDSAEGLGISLGTTLIPPLTAMTRFATDAVNAFNSLPAPLRDTAVVAAASGASLLLLVGSVGTLVGRFRDLTDAGRSVIRMFGEKEAAKRSLTAANDTLQGSVGKTGGAMRSLPGPAKAAAGAFGELALAIAGVSALLAGPFAVKDAFQGTEGKQREIQGMTDATQQYNFAIKQGATLNDDFAQGFVRFVAEMRASGTTFASVNEAWNAYLGYLKEVKVEAGNLKPAPPPGVPPAPSRTPQGNQGADAGLPTTPVPVISQAQQAALGALQGPAFTEAGKAAIAAYVQGFSDPAAFQMMQSFLTSATQSLTAQGGGVLSDQGKAQLLNAQVLFAQVTQEITTSGQASDATIAALTQTLGAAAPPVLSLIDGYQKLAVAQTAYKVATESVASAQRTLTQVQQDSAKAIGAAQQTLTDAQNIARGHQQQMQDNINRVRDQMTDLQTQADAVDRGWQSVLKGLNTELDGLQQAAAANQRAWQAAIDQAQAELAGMQETARANAAAFDAQLKPLREQAEAARTATQEHAAAFQAILSGTTQEFLRQNQTISDQTRAIIARYDAEVAGKLRAKNAADDKVQSIEAKARADILRLELQIRAAREAGNRPLAKALEQQQALVRKRAEYAGDLARQQAAVAADEARAAAKPVEDAAKRQAEADATNQKRADSAVSAVEAEKKAQAERDQAAITAKQQELAAIQENAKAAQQADQDAIAAKQRQIRQTQELQQADREAFAERQRNLQAEITEIERQGKITARQDQERIDKAQEHLDTMRTFWGEEETKAKANLEASQQTAAAAQQELDARKEGLNFLTQSQTALGAFNKQLDETIAKYRELGWLPAQRQQPPPQPQPQPGSGPRPDQGPGGSPGGQPVPAPTTPSTTPTTGPTASFRVPERFAPDDLLTAATLRSTTTTITISAGAVQINNPVVRSREDLVALQLDTGRYLGDALMTALDQVGRGGTPLVRRVPV